MEVTVEQYNEALLKAQSIKEDVRLAWTMRNRDAAHSGITCLTSYLEVPFDKEGVAQSTYNAHHNDPASKYFMMSVEDIIHEWDEHAAYKKQVGRIMDDYIGLHTDPSTVTRPDGSQISFEEWDEINQFTHSEYLRAMGQSWNRWHEKAYSERRLAYIGRELPVSYVLPSGKVCNGCIDYLCYDALRDKVLIIDWKTTEKIKIVPDCLCSPCLGPADHLFDNTMTMYTFQILFYKMCLLKAIPSLKPSDIEACVVQIQPTTMYSVYKPSFKYDSKFLEECLEWAFEQFENDPDAKVWSRSDTTTRRTTTITENIKKKIEENEDLTTER